MTAHLVKNGFKVNLCEPLSQFSTKIEPLLKRGGIEGRSLIPEDLTGFFKPNLMTTNIKEAIEGVDAIMITARAPGHGDILKAALPYLESDQIITTWTSYFFCLRYYETLKKAGLEDVIISETSILPYFTKMIEPTVVNLRGIKSKLWAAAVPSKDTQKVLNILKKGLPMDRGSGKRS